MRGTGQSDQCGAIRRESCFVGVSRDVPEQSGRWLLQKEPDGIVTIKFSDTTSAQACVLKNNNRFFGGRQLKAWIYDGKTRYSKSGANDSLTVEGESEDAAEQRRLEEFGRWLEEDGS